MPIHVSARLGYPGAHIPGTTTPTTRYGISQGANINNSINLVGAPLVRSYSTNLPATWAATSSAHNAKAGTQHNFSVKIPTADWCDSTSANYTATRDTLRTLWKGMPSGHHYVTVHHEPIGDTDITAAQYVQGHKNLITDVMVNVNNARGTGNELTLVPCLNGFPAAQSQFDTYLPNSLFTTAANNSVPILSGIDCYGFWKSSGVIDTTQQPPNDQIKAAHDWAKGRGLPWCIPELGGQVGGAPGDRTDADHLKVMQYLDTYLNSATKWPAAEQPVFVAWFNGNSSTIQSTADTAGSAAAFWTNLCATGA